MLQNIWNILAALSSGFSARDFQYTEKAPETSLFNVHIDLKVPSNYTNFQYVSFFVPSQLKFLAQRLYSVLNLLLIYPFQVDLVEIKAEYEKMKGLPLKQVIESRLKGDLEALLLQILGD